MSSIKTMWNQYYNCTFPEKSVGKEIRGVCITSIDSFAAGCISTYIDDGRLDPERLRVLEDCLEDLEQTMSELNGAEKKYFLKLQAIGIAVVGEINNSC